MRIKYNLRLQNSKCISFSLVTRRTIMKIAIMINNIATYHLLSDNKVHNTLQKTM